MAEEISISSTLISAIILVNLLDSSRLHPALWNWKISARLSAFAGHTVTLYNALAGDYNRLRDERAAPAFSPTLFSPLLIGGITHDTAPLRVPRRAGNLEV